MHVNTRKGGQYGMSKQMREQWFTTLLGIIGHRIKPRVRLRLRQRQTGLELANLELRVANCKQTGNDDDGADALSQLKLIAKHEKGKERRKENLQRKKASHNH